MKTLNLDLPTSLDIDEKELLILLASKLYERGKLSLGQAAKLAGFSKRDFVEVLGKYGVSVFNQSADDLESDIENARNYRI